MSENLSDYKFWGFQNIQLGEQLKAAEKDPTLNIDLKANQEKAGPAATACMLGYLQRYDWTFIHYAYKHEDKEYGFAWETYYDETHRALGPDCKKVWYDEIKQGDLFKVKIIADQPRLHYIIDEKFRPMNGTVLFLGEL